MDKDKRWGNSATKGHGVNSPAMMEARKGFASSKSKAIHAKMGEKGMDTRHKLRKEHEGRIEKIDKMSHQELIKSTPHYKRMASKLGL